MPGFRAGRIWGLADGDTGKALTTGFEASDGDVIPVYGPTDLVCDTEVFGVAADKIEFRIDVALDSNDFQPLPSQLDMVDVVKFGERVYELNPAPLGQDRITFTIPWKCDVRLMARRVGGGAGTLLDVYARARRLDGGDGSGGAGGGAIAVSGGGGGGGAAGAAYDPVIDALRTAEQAGPETVLTGETLFDISNVADSTYEYYVEHDGRDTFAMDLLLTPGGGGTITVTLEAAYQDDGTAIAARTYTDVTTVAFPPTVSWTVSTIIIDNVGVLRDAKSLKWKVVIAGTGGVNVHRGFYKSSYGG
jgi:hypothetical protein